MYVYLFPASSEYPKLSRFCYSALELHAEYGLSMEGKLPKDLTDEDLPPEQWLTVFKVPEKKNTKLFLHMVHDHLYDACRHLYQKVYQAAPSNREVMAKFARGFAFENCAAAKAAPNSHKIAWAVVGGMVLENVKSQRGGLSRKVSKFMLDYGVVGLLGPSEHVSDSNALTLSTHPAKPSEAASQPLYMEWVNTIAVDLDGQIHAAEAQVESAKVVLIDKRDVWLRNEGSYSAYAPIISEMEKLKAEMEILKASPQENEAAITKMEAEIGVLHRVVSMAGALTTAAQLKEEVYTMQVLPKLEHLLFLKYWSKHLQVLVSLVSAMLTL